MVNTASASTGAGDETKAEEQGLQLIGQEFVPVRESKRSEGAVAGSQKERVPEEQFSSPKVQKPLGNSPELLQLENQSSQKSSAEEKSMAVVPNGPPKTFAPPGTPSLPLFAPDQLQQLNDPRNSSSMLPFGQEVGPGGALPRLPAFFQHVLPGLDHLQVLQEQRQRELEWRAAMEAGMEQLDFNSELHRLRPVGLEKC